MKKCPICGYVRRAADDEFTNAPANACPKCYAYYDPGAASDRPGDDFVSNIQAKASRLYNTEIRKTKSSTYWLFAVLAFAALVYFTSEKPDSAPEKKLSPDKAVQAVKPGGTGTGEQAKVQNISEIAGRIRPSVVSVVIYNGSGEPIGRASGFFFGARGNVVTNYHALKGSRSAEIKTAAGKAYAIHSVVAEDRPNDLVLVSTGTPREDIRPLQIGSGLPQIGEKIVVIGNPLGLEHTVSDGIVSAVRESKDAKTMIQITAPISPGSSGSPVVNMRGEVIGVAFMQLVGGQNLNFCIPAESVARLGSGPSYAMGDFAAFSADKVYCYLDENRIVRLVKNPDNAGADHVLLTRSDGSLDRERFEKWVFEILGANPYKVDPQAEVEAERARLPEHFRKVFPGYEVEHLGRFTPEARAYWGSWVSNRLQGVFDRASRTRQEGIAKHKQLMEYFDRYASRSG